MRCAWFLVGLVACDHAFGISTVGPPPPIDAAPPPPPDAPPAELSGCADGSREGFLDLVAYPNIAACAGAWNVAGLTAAAFANGCTADIDHPCTAADLCAPGWTICLNRTDVAIHGAGACDATATAGFYATLQRSMSGARCLDDLAYDNDLFGCDAPTPRNPGVTLCSPLDGTSGNQCLSLSSAWSCPDGSHELTTVLKVSVSDGGVLCCKQ